MKRILSFLLLLSALPLVGQTTAPYVNPRVQFWNGSSVCSGCLLYTYSAGTTTPKATYSDSGAVTQNANPITLDSTGSAVIYFGSGSYKLVLQTSLGAQIWSQDNITPTAFITALTNPTITGTITQYNGVNTVANGFGVLVAKADATAQSANISTTTLYAVPSTGAGLYRVHCYVILTTAAGVSSTLPGCTVSWTDNDTAVANGPMQLTAEPTTNTVGTSGNLAGSYYGVGTINVKASTNIQYATTAYASSPAAAMQYAVHLKLEYLGN